MQGTTPLPVYVYIASPENPQYPCKPPSGYILGYNIPTIFLLKLLKYPLGGCTNKYAMCV